MEPLNAPTRHLAPATIERVRRSLARLQPAAEAAAQAFYARLFEAHPELRPLFKGDMQAQGAKLMEMLSSVAAVLTRPWGLAPMLRRLGERHAGYGVLPWQYRAVGTALLRALQDVLGPEFGPDERRAWAEVYSHLAEAMQMAGAASVLLATTREACNGAGADQRSA